MKDFAVLIDENDKVVGYKDKLEVHRWPAALHRAISVILFNGDKILLQKRANGKPVWPLFWSNTVCANVTKGETYISCAKRRLKEEMGIEVDIKEIFRFKYKRKYDKNFGEHELDTVFIGEYSGNVTPNPQEAAGFKWIDKNDLEKDMRKNPQKYTPWFKIILKKLQTLKILAL